MQTGRNGCIVCKLLSVKEWRASAGEKSLRNKEGNKGWGIEKKGGQGANLEYYACRFVLSKVIKTGTVHIATVHFQMYEPATGASKQFGAILQHASAPGVLFQAPSSVAAAGPYVTVVRKTLHHCCH